MIIYSFFCSETETPFLRCAVDPTQALEYVDDDKAESWTAMELARCDCCSLPAETSICPAALAIQPVVQAFGDRISFDPVRLEVELRATTVCAETQMQEAGRSLIGLLLPLSTCPVMSRLRPMARFHQPLADPEHTVFRVFGMHLLGQYIRRQRGENIVLELDSLRYLYSQIHEVNQKLAQRLRKTSVADANVNSVALLDTIAHAVDFGFDHNLNLMGSLFDL